MLASVLSRFLDRYSGDKHFLTSPPFPLYLRKTGSDLYIQFSRQHCARTRQTVQLGYPDYLRCTRQISTLTLFEPNCAILTYSSLFSAGDMTHARAKLRAQLEHPDYVRFLRYMCPAWQPHGLFGPDGADPALCPRTILGTWDDHDYNWQDGNRRLPRKEAQKQLYLDALGVRRDDPRREVGRGLYAKVSFRGWMKILRRIEKAFTTFSRCRLTCPTDVPLNSCFLMPKRVSLLRPVVSSPGLLAACESPRQSASQCCISLFFNKSDFVHDLPGLQHPLRTQYEYHLLLHCRFLRRSLMLTKRWFRVLQHTLNQGVAGKEIDVFLLDGRYYRDPKPCALRREFCEKMVLTDPKKDKYAW